jgi:amino acid transporter
VIDALIVTRILVQFMGQIVGLILLRKSAPTMPRPYRMWLYPLPALIALLGWIFVFATTQISVIFFGLAVLGLGVLAFLLWSWNTKRWPFGMAEAVS